MRRGFCAVLSGLTAYFIALAVYRWESQYSCPASVCGPDELPTWVFICSWGALYLLACKGTGRR